VTHKRFQVTLDAESNPAACTSRSHWISSAAFLLCAVRLVAADVLSAAEQSTNAEATEQLKQLNDQTIIGSRIFLDTEWDHLKDGAEKATWTLGVLWGWHLSEWQDWAVRLKAPIAYDRSDQASGHTNTAGLGDIELGTGTAFRLSNAWRTAGGIELHADTASDAALAEKVWRLKPGWGIAHDFTDWFTLTFNAEYNHSIAERGNTTPHRYLELSLPCVIILPNDWSILGKYKTKTDFENGGRCTHTLNGGAAKRLSSVPFVLSADLEKPLNGGAKKFQVNFTMTYYFQK
jgi:hypothetical protein